MVAGPTQQRGRERKTRKIYDFFSTLASDFSFLRA
jgi:hypothetical protein